MMKTLAFLFLLITTIYQSNGQTPSGKSHTTNPLEGIWSLVAVENTNPDGTKTFPYGQSPVGMLVLDDHDYAIQILKAVRPKVAANDKNKATPEENAALVQGNNSHFGTYSLNESKQLITFHVDHAFYPNWEGTIQERTYTLSDNRLSYVVTNTTNGGAVTAVVIWEKKKP
ncbi:MAG: lipocalin-like domain-containing protein [Dyadobacter sp.]|uniref:lipocalin-like domain-containing protein n=1 Tax=Dyadobacter sp. TaxID=1914288 RepID=UPI003264456E